LRADTFNLVFPTIGKWFVWAGAANLWLAVITYDRMMFQDLWSQTKSPKYMVLAFSATTVLLTWSSVELVADALRRMRARRAMPPAEPRPLSRGVWIFGERFANHRLVTGGRIAEGCDSSQVTDLPLVGQPIG
jgi:hypothetical protein